jgi:hypothetical protein
MSKSRNNALEFSSVGSIIIDSAAGATAGNFGAIQFLKDATISAIAGSAIGNIAKLQTTFSAGTVLYGKFSSVTLSSGLVALHKV